jgi:hypothetical protein
MAAIKVHTKILTVALLCLMLTSLAFADSYKAPDVFRCPLGCAGVKIGDAASWKGEPTCPPGTKCETKGLIVGFLHCYCKPRTGFFTGMIKG